MPDHETATMRVVVADDQPLMLRAISELIEQEPQMRVVGQAKNGSEALELAQETQPDVVLTDLDMPIRNGVELIADLQALPQIKTLALTTFASTDWVIAALRAGASGYLVKDAAPDEIVDAIRQVLTNTMVVSPSVVKLLSQHVIDDPYREPKPTPDDIPELQEREQAVVELLATGKSNREIAEALFISEGSVKLHLSRACEKLQVRDRVQLLVRAVEWGLASPRLGGSRRLPSRPS